MDRPLDKPFPPSGFMLVHDYSLLGVVVLTEMLARATTTVEIFSDYLEKNRNNDWLGEQQAQRRDDIAAGLKLARLTAEYYPALKHISA